MSHDEPDAHLKHHGKAPDAIEPIFTVRLMPGTTLVRASEIPRLISHTLYPATHVEADAFSRGFKRVEAEREHKKLMKSAVMRGHLKVLDPTSLGPLGFPHGDALDRALVTIRELRKYLHSLDAELVVEAAKGKVASFPEPRDWTPIGLFAHDYAEHAWSVVPNDRGTRRELLVSLFRQRMEREVLAALQRYLREGKLWAKHPHTDMRFDPSRDGVADIDPLWSLSRDQVFAALSLFGQLEPANGDEDDANRGDLPAPIVEFDKMGFAISPDATTDKGNPGDSGVSVVREFIRLARPLAIDPDLANLNSAAMVLVHEDFGGTSGVHWTSVGAYRAELEDVIARQADGFFTVREAAQVLVDTYPAMNVADLVERLSHESSGGLRLLRGPDRLRAKDEGHTYRPFLDLVCISEVNAWLSEQVAGYQFPTDIAPNEHRSHQETADLTLLATRQQLIDAFGPYSGMSIAWFDNLRDRPGLLASRRIKGRGQHGHTIEPMFCPYEVMMWLAGPKKLRAGRNLSKSKGWELLERHFPKVHRIKEVGDPRLT